MITRPSLTFHIFDFTKTAEQNFSKLDRKQELNVLYQVCIFQGRSEKQEGNLGLWLAETFSTSTKPLFKQNLLKVDRKQETNVLYQVCDFAELHNHAEHHNAFNTSSKWILLGFYFYIFGVFSH